MEEQTKVKEEEVQETPTKKPVNIGDKIKGEIKLPKLDLTQYIGVESVIASVNEYEGIYGYYFEVETTDVGTYTRDGVEKQLTARMQFGIHTDADGNLGYGEGTKTALFLKTFEVEHHKDLVGKKVKIQVTANKEGKEFLTFVRMS